MTGVILIRAKAGMTIPAAPRTTSASLKPEVAKLWSSIDRTSALFTANER